MSSSCPSTCIAFEIWLCALTNTLHPSSFSACRVPPSYVPNHCDAWPSSCGLNLCTPRGHRSLEKRLQLAETHKTQQPALYENSRHGEQFFPNSWSAVTSGAPYRGVHALSFSSTPTAPPPPPIHLTLKPAVTLAPTPEGERSHGEHPMPSQPVPVLHRHLSALLPSSPQAPCSHLELVLPPHLVLSLHT